RARLLPVAEHGALLRAHLESVVNGTRFEIDPPLGERPPAQEEGTRQAQTRGGCPTAGLDCTPPGSKEVFLGEDQADAGREHHAFSFSRRSSLTSFGLARPSVSFITWPTKKPSRPSFPARYDSTCCGFAASTWSMSGSRSDASLIWPSPR